MTTVSGTDPARSLPSWLQADLRSDHAGELGAVNIYEGILFATKDPVVRAFAVEHLATERVHLACMETLLPPEHRSRLQWPWRGAGWLIGCVPAAISSQWVFATIATVETFVDKHYTEQIDRLTLANPEQTPGHITQLLQQCRADEVQHRQDAAARLSVPLSLPLQAWLKVVEWGSRGAVVVARAI